MASTIQFLQADGVQQLMSKDDAKEVSKEVAHMKGVEEDEEPLRVSIRALRKQLQDTGPQRSSGEVASGSGSRGRGRGRGRGRVPEPEPRPRYPTKAPAGERLELIGARALLPPGYRLHEDDFNA
eukprot:16429600-Heterocapsa_arctica.AAC.1